MQAREGRGADQANLFATLVPTDACTHSPRVPLHHAAWKSIKGTFCMGACSPTVWPESSIAALHNVRLNVLYRDAHDQKQICRAVAYDAHLAL